MEIALVRDTQTRRTFVGEKAQWRPLFDRLVEAAGGDGIEVVPQKTRIGFMTSGWIGHEILLTDQLQIDGELRRRLELSRRMMGNRERLG